MQNTLTSAEESFNATSHIPLKRNVQTINVQPSSTQQLANVRQMSSLWSVEHYPLSLSRCMTSIKSLFLPPYHSAQCIMSYTNSNTFPYVFLFSTTGYDANILVLVMHECSAQLNHPNCVCYYSSWLGEDFLAWTFLCSVYSFVPVNLVSHLSDISRA
jgi:hypothetical protein